MLHEFLAENRDELIVRCRQKASLRSGAAPNRAELEYGVPLFLDQLTQTLHLDSGNHTAESVKVAGPVHGAQHSASTEIGVSATKHGTELLQTGFNVGQVVHDYGDLCQAVTELAMERRAPISVEEFHTFNRCLDNAIADAVTAYSGGAVVKEHKSTNERLGFLAHEMRNLLHSVVMALNVIRKGSAGFSGATAGVLDRNLAGMSHLIERSLAEVRLEAELPPLRESIAIDGFIRQCEVIANLEAATKSIRFTVHPVEKGIGVSADRQMLSAAVSNLLQNAFKFTWPFGDVSLRVLVTESRVLIDVEDECGGLPPGKAAELIRPFLQHGTDRSGLGLGLTIVRRSVEANGGNLKVRDIPGKGCVFTIDLPRERRQENALPGKTH
jgi:signal transduction histidine kinase